MARKSSLRARTNTLAANLIFSGVGPLVLAAGLAAAIVGPAALALLLAIPVNVWVGMRILRERRAEHARARRLAVEGDRATCVVSRAEPVAPERTRGGQTLQRVECVLAGGETVQAEIFWTAAAPGVTGIADRLGEEVHLYFAEGPETVEELEDALDLELGLRAPRRPAP